jgi:hypothetical protein
MYLTICNDLVEVLVCLGLVQQLRSLEPDDLVIPQQNIQGILIMI